MTVEDCLKGKPPDIVALYFAFESAVRACGDVRIHATKARIGFIARMTFAGAKPKRDHVEAGIILPYRSDSERFHKFFPSGRGGAHYLKLTTTGDIDAEVHRWLSEAYRVGMQEKLDQSLLVRPEKFSHPSLTRKLPKRASRSAKIFYFHWNEKELEERSEILRRAGHEVRGHWSIQVTAKFGHYLPDVFVISLDRLPSHGRAYAGWIWEAKKRQNIPIIFAGGHTDKIDLTRELFPNAFFCGTDEIAETIARVLKPV